MGVSMVGIVTHSRLALALFVPCSKSKGAQPSHHDPNHAVVRHLGSLYSEMDRTTQAVTPMMFTTVFRSTFPQFAETNNEGAWMQQDAEEALIQLMNAMANVLKKEQIATGGGVAGSSSENNVSSDSGGEHSEAAAEAAGSSRREWLHRAPGASDVVAHTPCSFGYCGCM